MQELGLLLLKVVVTPIVYNICTKTGVLLGTKKSFATPTRTGLLLLLLLLRVEKFYGTPYPRIRKQRNKETNKQRERERFCLRVALVRGKQNLLSFLCAFSHVVASKDARSVFSNDVYVCILICVSLT